jgi:hypothetical protein
MKRTSLSKSFRTIGLMAMLSVTIATTLQQPIQAQSKGDKIPTKDATACITLPEGKTFFNEFEGMTFSRKQDKAYLKIQADRNKKSLALSETYVYEDGSEDGVFSNEYKPGIGDKKIKEIRATQDALYRKGFPNGKVRKLLTEKYSKYATFPLGKVLNFTPKQIATGKKIWRDFEAQVMAILTPEQQKIYQAKLVTILGLEACTPDDPTSPRMFSSYTTVDGIKRNMYALHSRNQRQ